jgi:alanine racemase
MQEAVHLGLTVTLYDLDSARELSRAARALSKPLKVHLKVDTGMGPSWVCAEPMR